MSLFQRTPRCPHNTVRFHTGKTYVGEYDVTVVGYCLTCGRKVEQRLKGVPYRGKDTDWSLIQDVMAALSWRYRGDSVYNRTDARKTPVFLNDDDRDLLLTAIQILPENERARLADLLNGAIAWA